MLSKEEVTEKIRTFPSRLLEYQIPATGTADKFIGGPGTNLIFYLGEDQTGKHVYCSPYAIIKRLSLGLGDPEVGDVSAIFSRMTHYAEVVALGDPGFARPDFSKPFNTPPQLRDRVRAGLTELNAQGKRIPIDCANFMAGFYNQLIKQDMPHLAAKLIQG